MSRATQAQEPSMEEILASIRRIISDDEAAPRSDAVPMSPPAPQPTVPETEPAPDMDAETANSQDDIDALFAADDVVDPVEDAAGDEASPASEDEILDLTEEMRAPEPSDADEAAEPVEVASEDETFEPAPAENAFAAEDEVIFREPGAAFPKAMQDEPASAADDDAGADIAASMAALRAAGLREKAEERLLSPDTDVAVSAAFSNLATLILSKDARTLEDLVKEMLRPMLKAWLDDNLPQLVERLVREEIERVSRVRR